MTDLDEVDLADKIHAVGEEVPKNLTPPSERTTVVPNRAAKRRFANSHGERQDERSRITRLSRKQREARK